MSTKPRTRNISVKSAGRTPVTPSKTVYSLMVRIDWTTAKTVTITALEDFDMPAHTIDTRTGLVATDKTGKVTGNVSVKVLAGTTLHFVRSSFDGLYYVGRMSHEVATCTCGHYQNRHECKHQDQILVAHQAKTSRVRREIAAEFTHAATAIETPAEAPTLTIEGDDAEEVMMDEEDIYEAWRVAEEQAIVPQVSSNCPVDFAAMTLDERRAFHRLAGKQQKARDRERVAVYRQQAQVLRQAQAV